MHLRCRLRAFRIVLSLLRYVKSYMRALSWPCGGSLRVGLEASWYWLACLAMSMVSIVMLDCSGSSWVVRMYQG